MRTPSEYDEGLKKTPNSIKEIMNGIDFLFRSYVSTKSNTSILPLVTEKGGIFAILKTIYGDKFDWESDQLLDPEELEKFLEAISEIGDEIYGKHETSCLGSGSPLCRAGQHFFANDNVTTQDMVILESFFRRHLVEKWSIKTDETLYQEQQQALHFEFNSVMRVFLKIVIGFIATDETLMNDKDTIQLILMVMSKLGDHSNDVLKQFLSGSDTLLTLGSQDNNQDICNSIHAYIEKSFPNISIIEHTRYKVDIALIPKKQGSDSSPKIIELLPSDNFYFKSDEELEQYEGDQFPGEGQIIGDQEKMMYKNINIFAIDGRKVFWGDISKDDIKKIHSTYYILTNNEGWRDIPEAAKGNVRSILAASKSDKYMSALLHIPVDTLYILPDYMRMKALGKIQKGVFIKNNTQIEL